MFEHQKNFDEEKLFSNFYGSGGRLQERSVCLVLSKVTCVSFILIKFGNGQNIFVHRF